jgi:hypothetical protein
VTTHFNLFNRRTHRRLRQVLAIALLLLGGAAHERSLAQWRADQPPVMSPPVQRAAPTSDVANAFRAAYEAAGKPRVLLFWNTAFDDATQMTHQTSDVTKRGTKRSTIALRKDTTGAAGTAVLTESDGGTNETIEHVRTERDVDPAKQASLLSARNAAELEATFRQQLMSAGVRLVDRATAIRTAQAERDRSGVDGKLLEADAVLKAELLLQIVMVQDASSPLGAGFKISVTDVRTGNEVASLYTLATPQVPPPAGRYVATDSGFEWSQPPRRVGVADVGVALSREVMRVTGPYFNEQITGGTIHASR